MRNLMVAVTALFLLVPSTRAEDSSPPPGLTRRMATASEIVSSATPVVTITIPAQTEVAAELLSGIHSRVSHVGDLVEARISQPLYIDGRIALPPGTLLDGRITRIRNAGHLHRPAELALRFDRIALPDGQAEPVKAVLASLDVPRRFKTRLDPEGYVKGAGSFSWKGVAGGLVALGAFGTVKGAVAGSAALGTIIPIGAATLVSYDILWPRGNDVHLPPDTNCFIRLTYPVTLRLQW